MNYERRRPTRDPIEEYECRVCELKERRSLRTARKSCPNCGGRMQRVKSEGDNFGVAVV